VKVKNLSKGDHVIGTFDPTNLFGQQMNWLNGHGGPVDGVLREYFTIPATAAVKLPENSPQSFSEWSTLVCTGVTAWNALYALTPLKPGQIVLALGKIC
jgi:NADPH:quinone reductase-like Zn-dependent oxidoreductase